MPDQKILIVGYGDIGRRVAQHYTGQGQTIAAACRQTPNNSKGDSEIEHIAADLDCDQATIHQWLDKHSNSLAYWFAPPQKSGQTDERIRQFCETLKTSQIKRFVYISTTAVYGDCQGRWIDEDEPLKPSTDRGRRRQDAEQCLQEAAKKLSFELVILRVPGIYGPGRWPLARLKKSLPVLREEESPYTNRIHQDDLANTCVAAMNKAPTKPAEWRAYNVSDGHPSTMTDYFNQIADAFDFPQPPQVSREQAERELTPAMLSFMNESKRLATARTASELGYQLQYNNLTNSLS